MPPAPSSPPPLLPPKARAILLLCIRDPPPPPPPASTTAMACRAKPASSPPFRAALAAPGRCRRRRWRPRDRGCPLLPNPRRAAPNPRRAEGNGGRAEPDPNDGNGNLRDDSDGWRRLATVQTTATAAGDLDDDGGAPAWVQDARRCSLRHRPALLRRIEEVVAAPAVALRSWLCTAAADRV
uniref:Uncharacterized protein n=1 Tax=Oryza nivara TaxID=4536 RepID=A0A0E0H3E6_ORYNI